MSNKKIIGILSILLLTALIVAIPTPASASPDVIVIKLQDQLTAPVHKDITEVRLIVWNTTTGYETLLIDAVGGAPDETGTVVLTPTVLTTWTNTWNVNITILLKTRATGDTYLLFYYATASKTFSDINQTTTPYQGNHWWNLKFKAITNLNRTVDWGDPNVYEVPLYFEDPERPGIADAAVVRIYFGENETYPLLAEYTVDSTGTTGYFNFTDSLATVDAEGHVTFSNVTLYALTKWCYDRIVVGKALIELGVTPADVSVINITDKVDGTKYVSEAIVNDKTYELRTYTWLVKINLKDWDGNPFTPKASELKAFWEFGDYVVRSGKANDDKVPAEGYTYVDGAVYFWLPDVWTIYKKNLTLEITYLRVPVYVEEINVTDIGPNVTYNGKPIGSVSLDTKLQVVKLKIIVKDKEPIAQPLAGARIEIYYNDLKLELAPGMTVTTTDTDGGVYLPPFTSAYVTTGGDLVVSSEYSPYGYLPVPVDKTSETYEFKVYWKFGNSDWIDVTDAANSTITVKLSEQGKTWLITAKVFEASFIFKSYCGELLTSTEFADNKVYVYYGGNPDPVYITTLTPEGVVVLPQIPPGEYSFKLYWKWVTVEPYKGNATITITDNIIDKPVIYWPFVSVVINTYNWQKQPVGGLQAAIFYNVEGTWVIDPQGWVKADSTETSVEFKKIPANVKVRLLVNTSDNTWGIRDGEVGVLVYQNDDFVIEAATLEDCTITKDVYTWIYSFKLIATDCTGKQILTGVKAYDESKNEWVYYNVTILIDDAEYTTYKSDFRFINVTHPYDASAIFEYKAVQTNVTTTGVSHIFIAGRTYLIKVYYMGVMVYNYTITLPMPWETVTMYFNETAGEPITEVPEINATYHPIYTFTGVAEPTPDAIPEITLYTWVIPLDIYTTTISGASDIDKAYALPNVNVTIKVEHVLAVTQINNYTVLSDDSESGWYPGNTTTVRIGVMTDETGKAHIKIPMWVPYRGVSKYHFAGTPARICSGINVTEVYAYGSDDYETPGFVVDATTYIAYFSSSDLAKYGEIKPGFDWKNLTWCGDWIFVPTKALEHIMVKVIAPTRIGTKAGVEEATVRIYLSGTPVASATTDENGEAHFWVPTVGEISLPNGTTLPVVAVKPALEEVMYISPVFTDYTIETDLEAMVTGVLKNYGTVERADNIIYLNGKPVIKLEVLSDTVTFTEDYNCGGKYVTLEWGAILVRLLDWAGQPLRSMTVFASATNVTEGTIPYIFGVTDGEGIAILYVTGTRDYYIDAYWRDTYFLFYAGKIPKYINIYASAHDEEYPKNRVWSKGEYREVKVYVYKGVIKLLKADGTSLSTDALAKITVRITWPDGVVTEVKPKNDGSVPIVLNAKTVKTWPFDYSSNYNPDSPDDQPQTPPGGYTIEIYWTGITEPLYKGTVTVERGKYETPLIIFEVKLPVYDLEFKAVTAFGTPLANADVEAEVPGVGTVKFTLDAEGKGIIKEVPLGKATIKSIIWKGANILEAAKEITPVVKSVEAKNVGKLTVRVIGAMGQPDTETVEIKGPITKTVKVEGSYTEEVPAGTYTVNGKTVTVPAGGEGIVEITTGRIFGMPYTTLITYIVGIIIAIVIIAIILYEYMSYRTSRRLAKAIAPAKPEK